VEKLFRLIFAHQNGLHIQSRKRAARCRRMIQENKLRTKEISTFNFTTNFPEIMKKCSRKYFCTRYIECHLKVYCFSSLLVSFSVKPWE